MTNPSLSSSLVSSHRGHRQRSPRFPVLVGAAALGLCGAVLGTAPATRAQDAASSSKLPGVTQGHEGKTTLSDPERQYLTSVAKSNQTELAVAFLAIEKGASDGVKDHARGVIDDHVKSMKKLLDLVSPHDFQVPIDFDRGVVQQLQAVPGSAFDSAYVAAMQRLNQQADAAEKPLRSQFSDSDVKSFADQTESTDQQHLKEARDLAGKLKPANG